MELPKDLGKRLGDISDLPAELLKELNIKTDTLQGDIIDVMRNHLDGVSNIDELMVALYKKRKEITPRRALNSRLYNMTRAGLLERVEGKKGVYKIK